MPSLEYVHCVRKYQTHKSWCGKYVMMEFHFTSIEHAAATREKHDRLLVCRPCADRIAKVLRDRKDEV